MSIRSVSEKTERLGWSVEKTFGGHLKLTRPDVTYLVFTATANQRAGLGAVCCCLTARKIPLSHLRDRLTNTARTRAPKPILQE